MSKAQQVELNIKLSDELASFLITKPEILKKYSGYSYVVFSSVNPELNRLNNDLIHELLLEGNGVIKAEATGNSSQPWVLTPVMN